jgi:hypothetical protein
MQPDRAAQGAIIFVFLKIIPHYRSAVIFGAAP